jgi:hypothetical protein
MFRSDDTGRDLPPLAALPLFFTGVGSGTTSYSSLSDSYTFSFAFPFVFLGSLAIFFRPILFYTFVFISTTQTNPPFINQINLSHNYQPIRI